MATSTIKKNARQYGEAINIGGYSVNNKYSVPMDGIVRIYVNYRSGSYMQVGLTNADGSNETQFSTFATGVTNSVMPFPVFKGQKVWVASSNAGAGTNYLHFIPYESV